jgi:hypothetical protein
MLTTFEFVPGIQRRMYLSEIKRNKKCERTNESSLKLQQCICMNRLLLALATCCATGHVRLARTMRG